MKLIANFKTFETMHLQMAFVINEVDLHCTVLGKDGENSADYES